MGVSAQEAVVVAVAMTAVVGKVTTVHPTRSDQTVTIDGAAAAAAACTPPEQRGKGGLKPAWKAVARRGSVRRPSIGSMLTATAAAVVPITMRMVGEADV